MPKKVRVVSIEQADAAIERIFQEFEESVKRAKQSSVVKAGQFFIKVAKYAVPVDSGYTRNSIKGNKVGKDYVVTSNVRNAPGNTKGFPYNRWLDRRPGITSYGKYYGTGAAQRSGVQVTREGGFWTYATKRTRSYFKDVLIRDLSK
jgi:hypothetical protein